MVNPMVEGSGLKNKVLEAFALGIPVVSTCLGVEGIDVEPGTHCAVSDSPKEFASAVLGFLDSEDEARRISQAARALVVDSYSWQRAGSMLLGVIDRLAPSGT